MIAPLLYRTAKYNAMIAYMRKRIDRKLQNASYSPIQTQPQNRHSPSHPSGVQTDLLRGITRHSQEQLRISAYLRMPQIFRQKPRPGLTGTSCMLHNPSKFPAIPHKSEP